MSYGFIPLNDVICQLKSKKFILIPRRPPDDPITTIHIADGFESFFSSSLSLSFRS
jgi:hypothetical protein